jgi:branched-chain amino acid transport system permease protein
MGAVLLLVGPGLPYFVALPLGLLVALVLGALVEFVVIRRFSKAPRLILTVATLGLAQLLAGVGLALPSIANDTFPGVFDVESAPTSFPSPFGAEFEIAPVVFGGNDIIALVAVGLCIAGLAAFFRFTSMGIAVRASAESEDRANLLGIPVRRVQTVVWVLASGLAFLAVFLRAGVVGVPLGQVLGPAILIRALAACVIGGMTNLPLIFAGAVTLGMVEQAVIWDTRRSALVAPILFVVVLGMLLIQRRGRLARTDEQSSWQAVTDVRRVPPELAGLPEVRWAKRGLLAALALGALALPTLVTESTVNLAGVILVFAMVGVSLVVLTGWAGQVSLGPVAFLAIGAAVGGAVTSRLGWDLLVALVVAGAVGSLVSIVIGLPALRIRGLLLAVTTLAFAQAVAVYLLNQSDFGWWLPQGRLERGPLLGLVPIESETQYYVFTLACLVAVLSVARRLRHSRVGRVMIAVRENERGAQAYAVNLVRAKLTAFAVAGFIAAFAGAVFVHHQRSLGIQPYATEESLAAFTMVVIGGLGSLPGAVLGAVYVKGAQYFLPPELSFFVSGMGLLVVLVVLPGGLGSLLYQARDGYLRYVATRRDIMVPSLFADARDLDTVRATQGRNLDLFRELVDRMQGGPPPGEGPADGADGDDAGVEDDVGAGDAAAGDAPAGTATAAGRTP